MQWPRQVLDEHPISQQQPPPPPPPPLSRTQREQSGFVCFLQVVPPAAAAAGAQKLPQLLGPTLVIMRSDNFMGSQEHQSLEGFGRKTPVIAFPSHNDYYMYIMTAMCVTTAAMLTPCCPGAAPVYT